MNELIKFLSGNVPGGILLYVLILMVIWLILYFMFRVNEFFTKKHLVRGIIIGTILLSIIYWGIWFDNPPPHILNRYSIGLFQSNTKGNWFGEYITDFLTKNVTPYQSRRDYLFPQKWFYKITPPDSALSEKFLENTYASLPIKYVLTGKIIKNSKKFHATVFLIKYPGKKILNFGEGDYNIFDLTAFSEWIEQEFGTKIPFKQKSEQVEVRKPDSLLQLIKRNFYQKDYEKCDHLLRISKIKKNENFEYDLYNQYVKIKAYGEKSLLSPTDNPYDQKLKDWEIELKAARSHIINYLRAGKTEDNADLMVAESYIWQKDYAAAEIFLEKAYVDNPFNIDALLNLTFLHPSRYKKFGFRGVESIYRKILDYCPIDEPVLLNWSDDILRGNPAYTAPPKIAKMMVKKYLSINPHSYKAWLMLGKIYAQNLEREKALTLYLKADSIEPQSGLINYNIGVLFYEWGKEQESITYFDHSIKYENFLDSYLYLGSIYKDLGQYQKALKYFRYRVSRKKGDNDYYAIQGMKGIQECLKLEGGNHDSEEF